MTLARPRSILTLVLVGTLLVAAPLVAGLVIGVLQVRALTVDATSAVFRSGQAMELGRGVRELAAEVDRVSRQYLILKDEALLGVVGARSAELLETLGSLEALGVARTTAPVELRRLERALAAWLAQPPEQVSAEDPEAAHLRDMIQTAGALAFDTIAGMSRRADELRDRADRIEQFVLWQMSAAMLISAALICLLVSLINRPLRQVHRAITRMAEGALSLPVSVDGPEDLRTLGERLDYLRSRLLELEQQKVNFLRQVSHELKTPLSAIREGAQLLRDGVVGRLSREQDEIAGIIDESSVRLQALIEGLLEFSTQGPTSPLDRGETVELGALIDAVLEDQKLALTAKRLRVERQLDPQRVYGSREQLRVVVDNLLSNAIKFTSDGGTIRVTLGATDGQVTLEVQDTGPGVPEEDVERVFEMFYRGRTPAGSPVGSTGLGLAISKELVTLHRGEIACLPSEQGARFRVTLPPSSDRRAPP